MPKNKGSNAFLHVKMRVNEYKFIPLRWIRPGLGICANRILEYVLKRNKVKQ